MGRRDHVEQQLAAKFAGWDVTQLIKDLQITLRKLAFHTHQLAFLASFHQLGNLLRHALEADATITDWAYMFIGTENKEKQSVAMDNPA